MAHMLQIATPPTAEGCSNFIVDLKTAIEDLLAEFEEVQRARIAADAIISDLRMIVGDLESSRGNLLSLIAKQRAALEKQRDALQAAAEDQERLLSQSRVHQSRVDFLTVRLEAASSEQQRLRRACEYADRVLATEVSPAEHLGAVYGVGAALMTHMFLPAPPLASDLIADILAGDESEGGAKNQDPVVERECPRGAVLGENDGHEADAHARGCEHEGDEAAAGGGAAAARVAMSVLHAEEED